MALCKSGQLLVAATPLVLNHFVKISGYYSPFDVENILLGSLAKGHDWALSARVMALSKSVQILWLQLLLQFSTNFHHTFSIL